MIARIRDAADWEAVIADRRERKIDRYDEVWEGEYVMSPIANNEHQMLATRLAASILAFLGQRGKWCLAGANVSDREVEWTKNYRCPDVVVVLPDSRAIDRGTHWQGGPDFLVEIVSEGDNSRKKFDFYSAIGVRELLLIDRYPWALELYRLDESNKLQLVGRTEPNASSVVASTVLQLEFGFNAEQRLIVRHPDTGKEWSA